MTHRLLALAVTTAVLGWPGIALLHAQDEPITIRAGVLVDGTGDTITDARLVVEDGIITRVDRLRGTVTHDLSELVVMPGWIDTHVHLTAHFDPDGKTHRSTTEESEGQTMLHAVGNAYRILMAGFTTVQSLGSRLDAPLRDFIADGGMPGPRILTSLQPVTSETGDPDAIRAFVRSLAADGADVVKMFASASIRDGGGRTLSDEQIEAACGEARAHGLRTVVHAYGTDVVGAVIRAGCTAIEHGNRYDDSVIELMAERGTYLDPHVGLLYQNYFDHRDAFFGIGNYTAVGFARMEEARRIGIETFRRTRANDRVKVVFGTDAVAGAHGANADEFVFRVQDAGEDPMDAIRSATSIAAESLGLGDRIGTAAAGFAADLVAVEGNPLENIEAVRRVRWVMKGGRVYRDEVSPPSPSRPSGRRR